MAVDNSGFTPVLQRTRDTSTTFQGERGKTYRFICVAEDTAGNVEVQEPVAEAVTRITEAGFTFSGFFPPVDNPPTVNAMKAGSAVPVKFSLSGDQGLDIFAAGYPVSQGVTCDTSAPVDTIEQTVTAGGSGLTYDPSTDQYTYVWKTGKNWAGTCRQLTVRLTDGTDHAASFKFK